MDMEKITDAQIQKLLRLSDLWRRYDQVYSEWAQKHGVSTNVMTLIEEMHIRPDGVEPAEIADYLGIPRQTMTTTLDWLEKRGLLGRFPHVTDRRRKVIRFTPEGEVLAGNLVDELHKWELEALSTIDEAECKAAFRTVRRFCDELERGLHNSAGRSEDKP
ncbi:MAG: MarR family transcriptional regulator [Synergistaceae bacterium]|nr:MarR family transcriptional regulator [Synergistaceae bacterium]